MHYESRSQKSSSSDPPTTGSSGDPGGYRQQTACHLRPAPGDRESSPRRPGHVGRGGTAISLSPQRPHPLPLCRSVRAAALHPRHQPQRSGIPVAIRCAIPRTHRWAGAATPTQRNTTQAQERARRASDVINISNFTSKNKPRWRPEGLRQASPAPAAEGAGPGGGRHRAGEPRPPRPHPGRHRPGAAQLAGRPAAPPGRPAIRHERHRGLLARLADHQDARRPGPEIPRSAVRHAGRAPEVPRRGRTADPPCAPCLGTGRITLGQVS